MVRFFDAIGGKAAVYEGTGGNGEGDAPLHNPIAYLDRVLFHSDFDYLELAFRGTRTISHPSRAHSGYETGQHLGGQNQPTTWRATPLVTTHTLYNHNQGYRPHVLVQLGNEIITPGFAVQFAANNGVRVLTVIVTNSQVQLREMVWTWGGTLAALARTYEILGFLKTEAYPPGDDLDITPGAFIAGRGRIDSTRRYVREAVGSEERFWVTGGRTADVRRAVVRSVSPTGTVRDDARFSQNAYNYNGTFGADDVDAKALSIADSAEVPGRTETDIDPATGRFRVIDDGHIVVDSNRSMAKIVQEVSLSRNFSFPDPPQNRSMYMERRTGIGAGYEYTMHGAGVKATWLPQEWSQTIELATLPSPHCNFLLGQARGSQTKAPDKIGGGASITLNTGDGNNVEASRGPVSGITNLRDINRMIPEGDWIQVNGSIVLEASYMFRRLISFEIQNGRLVAILQQSVGGYSTSGSAYRGDVPSFDNSGQFTEVIARLYRLRGRIRTTFGAPDPMHWRENPAGYWDWSSRWNFDLNFLIGHV